MYHLIDWSISCAFKNSNANKRYASLLSSRAKRASDGKEVRKLSLRASVMSDVDTRGFARRSVSEMAIVSGFMNLKLKLSKL